MLMEHLLREVLSIRNSKPLGHNEQVKQRGIYPTDMLWPEVKRRCRYPNGKAYP